MRQRLVKLTDVLFVYTWTECCQCSNKLVHFGKWSVYDIKWDWCKQTCAVVCICRTGLHV